MTPPEDLLARQTAWQQSRRAQSWPEKIREAERLRSSVEAFRQMRQSRGARTERPPEPGAPARQRPVPRESRMPGDE